MTAGKPNPANYKKAMEELGTDTGNTIFVGDQIFTDVYGAHGSLLLGKVLPALRYSFPPAAETPPAMPGKSA